MSWKTKTSGGMLAIIGFLLSPLSWWNDLVINIPLAAALAWVASLFYKPAFYPTLFIGYWLTNVLGFVLMHKGAQKMLSPDERKSFRKELVTDIVISLLYTGVIFLLVKLGILKPLSNYGIAA